VTDKGDAVRLAILVELLRREEAGELPPTHREIGEAVGRSYTSARWHLEQLERKGHVTLWAETARGVMLTDAGRVAARKRRTAAN